MKQSIIICSLLLICSKSIAQEAPTIDEIKGPVGTNERSDDLPEGEKGAVFGLPSSQGGQGLSGIGVSGNSIVAPTLNRGNSQSVNFSAGLGYSCAALDPFDNVENILNSAEQALSQTPQQFVLALEGFAVSLPAYLLNRINPSLYNVITKQIDEGFELFETEYTNCTALENEIQQGNNPYGQLFRASVLRNTQIAIGGEGVFITDAMRQVREEGAAQGVLLEDGITFGGEGQAPVNISRSLIRSGANLILSRPASDDSAFANDPEQPITQAFGSPGELVEFSRSIYGDVEYDLTNPANSFSTAGIGFQHQYILERNNQIELLTQFINSQIARDVYQVESGSQISPAIVTRIRRLPPTQKDIAIDNYARDIALNNTLEKLNYLMLAVKSGLREPHIANSEAFEIVEADALKLQISIRNDIAQIKQAGS